MAQINFVCGLGTDLGDKRSLYSQAAQSAPLFDDYRQEVLIEDSTRIPETARFERYPVWSFEKDRIRAVVDGKVYGVERQVPQEQLFRLIGCVRTGDSNIKNYLDASLHSYAA